MKTHRENVYAKYRLDPKKTYTLAALATITSIPLSILKEVENRGKGAYYSGGKGGRPSPSVRLAGSYKKGVDAPGAMKLSMAQWSKARVFSFIDTYRQKNLKHDTDLAKSIL
jgi:hypothetical protein